MEKSCRKKKKDLQAISDSLGLTTTVGTGTIGLWEMIAVKMVLKLYNGC